MNHQVKLQLPQLNLNIKQDIYQKLGQINTHLSYQNQELISNERQVLIDNASKIGELFLFDNTWKKYSAILSGGYIYLYQKNTDKVFTNKIYIRNSDVNFA